MPSPMSPCPCRKAGASGSSASGSGKTTTALAAMRMLASPGFVSGGEIHLNSLGDTDILNLSEEEMRRVRLRKIAYIPQGAMNSLNPVMRIEDQIWDGILAHEGASARRSFSAAPTPCWRASGSTPRSWAGSTRTNCRAA
jgi:ABC-type dipeptide/oligopeptide/nickel transport system ATPase component